MKTRLLLLLVVSLSSGAVLAQPGIRTIVTTNDSAAIELSVGSGETLEVLMAYDFYGAGSTLMFTQGEVQFELTPGNAAGGLPHCTPQPFVIAGPVELTIRTGGTGGARTRLTPLVVTLEVKRARVVPPPEPKQEEGF